MSLRRLRLYWSMVRYANAHNRDFASEHWQFFQDLRARLAARGRSLEGLRVLEVGCGKAYWLTLLLHAFGARVTGIDTEELDPRRTPAKYWSIFRRNGLERAARTLIWDVVYARPYYRELERQCGRPLRGLKPDLRSGELGSVGFADGEFDLAVSHEVFEHIADVDAATAQVRRLLRPDGIAYLYVHSFTSISGGHHIAWKYPDTEPSSVVPPWDHLRERRFPDIPSWVNGLREHDYRAIFERHLAIGHWVYTKREGERLLTPEIRAELKNYSEHELLTKGFICIGTPRP